MTRVDMHLHSTYSKHPSEWFLQRIGAQESYTKVEDVYAMARRRGMTFVTVTDHNSIGGALELARLHPEDSFVSVESTAYFPEDGCKVHILVYGIDEQQFAEIERLRTNIYDLREYLRDQDLACSVAHLTYNVNARLTIDTVEKLILLFDVFEGINGARNATYNETVMEALAHLTPESIGRLQEKHGIEPWGDTPWIKGFTGGSDDHAGLFIGCTYTESPALSLPDFLESIRRRGTKAEGRHSDHKSLAFTVYKIAYEFSKTKGRSAAGFWSALNSLLFEGGRLGLTNWLAVQKLKMKKGESSQVVLRFFNRLLGGGTTDGMPLDEQVDIVYESVAELSDDYFRVVARSIENNFSNGDIARIIKNVSASLPALFLTAPFLSTLRHLHLTRDVLNTLRQEYCPHLRERERHVLWLSDTVTDLNGVAVTMRNVAQAAYDRGRSLKLVTTLPNEEPIDHLPPNVINMPCIYAHTPDFYTSFTLRVPSLLRALDIIASENPDEIIVSTPGPVGLVGVGAARLLDVKCTGVYHTDFTRQSEMFIGDSGVAGLIEAYINWFYRLLDEIRVPTEAYMGILEERGLDRSRMRIFRRGLSASFARLDEERQEAIRKRYGLEDGVTFLWAGRLGMEKNLDFLMRVYREACEQHGGINLLVVGDGPELERLREENAGLERLVFAGRVPHEELPDFYALAHAFLFPSTTDTFGMVILEAQACGLPALVTDVGGPQELIRDGETGHVLSVEDREAWVSRMLELADMVENRPDEYEVLRARIRECSQSDYSWDQLLDELMGPRPRAMAGAKSAAARPEPAVAAT